MHKKTVSVVDFKLKFCLFIQMDECYIKENEETKLDDEEMDNDHENNETLAADTTVPMDTNNQSTIPGSATKVSRARLALFSSEATL